MIKRLPIALWVVGALLGCGGDPDALTQIRVTVDSDLEVPEELDRVTIAVTGMVTDQAASADLREQPLPRHLTLVHEGGPLGPLRITATGFLGRTRVLERVVQTRFQAGKLITVEIELQRADTDGGEDGGDTDAGGDAGGDAGRDAGSDAGDAATGNAPPVCTIREPMAGASLTAGQAVRFEGQCDDPETGRIPSANLSWSSLQEGALCTGASCDATLTMPVAHTLRLCAPDPAAPNDSTRRGCAQRGVNVTLPPPPTVSIDSVTQSGSSDQPFSTGPAIAFIASADGQEITLSWRDTFVGAFGANAAEASLSDPLVGRHTVILSATDNVGQQRQASVTFVVRAGNTPLVQPFSTANGVLAAAGGARIDAIAADSRDHALVANGLPAVYTIDGGADPALAGVAAELTAPTLPADVRAIAIAEGDGRVYVATANGLVVCDFAASSGVGNSCMTFRMGNLPSNAMTAVVRARADGSDYLAIGTSEGLLATTNVNGANNGQTAFDGVAITGLAAADDAVWVATAGEGLWSYELANDAAHEVDGGPGAQLTAVAVDARGAVWVGSDSGVGRYDPAADSWLLLSRDQSPPPQLASDAIRSVTTARALIDGDPHDLVWVGTDAGVTRIDSTISTVMNLTEDDGLPSASVRGIVVLTDGSKLIATDSGLARYTGP